MFSGDYLSAERTFQLLTQAAGRAGRGSRPGKVIIQTYQPDHYCVAAAAAQDYEGFYRQEIQFRRMMRYPPAAQMQLLLAEGADDGRTEAAVRKLKEMAEAADFKTVEMIGPSKATVSRARDMYRYVLYMKHEDEKELIRIREFMEGYLAWSDQFSDIFFNFDLNPTDF